jgi:3-methyladenine DNA glycosylase AlkD
MDPEEIRKTFLTNVDPVYREFNTKIVVPGEHKVIGIRMPVIRKFAKEITKGDWKRYLNEIKDEYSEDLLLRGFIITHCKTSVEEKLMMFSEFIPLIDNWAVCDCVCTSLNVSKKNKDAVWNMILRFLNSDEEFEVRAAVVLMLAHFIDDEYVDRVISYADNVAHHGYYVRMAVAWCLSVCFVKYPEMTTEYLKNCSLDDNTFNKTISKITDSRRVDDVLKEQIRKMRRRKAV